MQSGQFRKMSRGPNSPMNRRRRKHIKPPPGQKPDKELIDAFIAEKGITVCQPGWAMGALKSSALGLDT